MFEHLPWGKIKVGIQQLVALSHILSFANNFPSFVNRCTGIVHWAREIRPIIGASNTLAFATADIDPVNNEPIPPYA